MVKRATYALDDGRYELGSIRGEAAVIIKDGEGQRIGRYSLRVPRKPETEARKALNYWVAKYKASQEVEASKSLTIGDLWEKYKARCERDDKVMYTIINQWNRLKDTFSHVVVDDLTEEMCIDYARKRFATGKKQWTVWSELNRLEAIINWSWDKAKIIKSRPTVWKCRQGEAVDRVLSTDEARRLLEAAEPTPHIKLFVLIALCTGARTTAILQLRWDKVDLDAGEIDFKVPLKELDPLSKRKFKGRAHVPIVDMLLPELRAAQEMATTPFVIEYNGRGVQNIKNAFGKARRRAKLEDITQHMLRHAMATWLREAGVPIETIAKILGHSESRVTEKIYAKMRPAALKKDMEKVSLNKGKRKLRVVK